MEGAPAADRRGPKACGLAKRLFRSGESNGASKPGNARVSPRLKGFARFAASACWWLVSIERLIAGELLPADRAEKAHHAVSPLYLVLGVAPWLLRLAGPTIVG